jgi:hypothetical protein
MGEAGRIEVCGGRQSTQSKTPKTETIALRWRVANKKKNTQHMQFILEYKVMWI